MNVRYQDILKLLQSPHYKPCSFSELASYLRIPRKSKRQLRKLLKDLENQGKITINKNKCYERAREDNFTTGTISKHARGFAFLLPDDQKIEDIFIKPSDLKDAMSGDKVAVSVRQFQRKGGKSLRGQVIKIIERAHKIASGVLTQKGYEYLVQTGFGENFRISKKNLGMAQVKDLVKIEVIVFPRVHQIGEAKVIQVLGPQGHPQAETESIIANHKLYTEFHPHTLHEVQSLPEKIDEKDLERRKDLRELPFVTIDGEDARDFDDAVYVQKKDMGFKLFVSIADVAHYVKNGSPTDKDAYLRGCSTYFPDKVLPMLPEKLSNNLCSLRPGEDRLTLTCEMDFLNDGTRSRYKIYESVIRSQARLTYTEIQSLFEQTTVIASDTKQSHRDSDEITTVVTLPRDDNPSFKNAYELFKILKDQKTKRGALDFDLPEPYVIVDETGKTTDIKKRARYESHMLIEEFMIAANEAVACELIQKNIPALFRTHEKPDKEKTHALRILLHNLGYQGLLTGESVQEFSRVLDEISGKPEEHFINFVLLRSMKQACYTPDNPKHFALASPYYTHFTSPIRRYPDLIVHRHLKYLNKNTPLADKELHQIKKILVEKGRHLSERERISQEAEREVVLYKQVLFMKDKEGEEFHGRISGVKEFGIFVELGEYFVEGLIPIGALTDDYYQFSESEFLLRGMKFNKEYKLGNPLKVRIQSVNVAKREIDLIVILSDSEESKV
ncbi:MAG: ribonuclease R [Deltaproteobacteria bacterium]|nr:ribonuclease R [Deltaproteobacteria bacterium]